MAVVTCPDCGRQVSDQAQACPQCARPLASSVQTIEQTNKQWKILKIASGVMVIGGLTGMAWSVGLGAFVAGTGFIAYLVASAGAYWSNG